MNLYLCLYWFISCKSFLDVVTGNKIEWVSPERTLPEENFKTESQKTPKSMDSKNI
jgi:hypothetical protein